MGQLITLANLEPNPAWFIDDAYCSWEGRRWIYNWPSNNFPHSVAIHSDRFEQKRLKSEIRRWIEINISSSVILNEVDKKYRVYYDEERTWEHSFEQSNTWVVFYFENKEDAIMFGLRFSEYAQEITDLHPTRNHEYEKTSYYKEN